jgi:hypothetical protein
MNSEYQKDLELEIDRELKQLSELEAPATLSRRVMLAIKERQALRWYSQPWQNWPKGLRIAALVLLSSLFGGLCVASWQLSRAAGMSATMQEIGGLFSGLTTLWNIINVLLGAIVLVAKHLGTGFIISCALIVGLGYALCLGLGTACVRLAFARK